MTKTELHCVLTIEPVKNKTSPETECSASGLLLVW